MFNPVQLQMLRLISEAGPLSRTELAGRTGMSKAAVSLLTRELLDGGLLAETETVRGTGRPSIRLGLLGSSAHFVGVSLVEAPVVMVLTDLNGKLLGRHEIDWSNDASEVGRLIAAGLPALTAGRANVAGVGVALSGYVDPSQTRCLKSTLLGWQDVPAASLMEAEIGLPTAIENDAKAVALGERLFGAIRDKGSFSLISVGDGIGCGHIINGRLYRGSHGGAGEIAHATIEPDGLPCRCGKRGCLDTVASLMAIQSSARTAGLPGDVKALEQLASNGHGEAIAILHRAGAALGLAIAQIIQIIDPERIIVTHRHGALDGLYGTVTRATIEANVLPRIAGEIDIQFRHVSADIWARGAASIAADKFLSNPVLHQKDVV
ncbi:ROK family transcriptional regulator [Consotaella salsifontis]|uniref:Sugar kinase of the NBD/HSP70 family, may contain an N-terminal HTH domain n=1 Tax=Consotaella salsifontis TaxID=1365950 RepID=A0A1T4SP96_9HYPH|nr:ROK family transcriptional regulator [Consotaella salsifontis]SKA29987.1 Sugar kinase of the NBD/HSP70 family, may contain an N-terminal HTH domain [Consotaella salsifontis]